MKPFSSHLTHSNLKPTLLMVAIPFVALSVGLGWIVQDSPSTAFKNYQKALSTSDWEEALAISDQNSFEYLDSLREWIGKDDRDELLGLGAFEQFLVLRARFEIEKKGLENIDDAELLGIWMKALDVRSKLIKTKIMNQYYFGNTAIGQLFNTKTHTNTGMKFRLVNESGWKVDTIALMRGFYMASGCLGTFEDSLDDNISEKGYLSRHPQALNPELPERHTL